MTDVDILSLLGIASLAYGVFRPWDERLAFWAWGLFMARPVPVGSPLDLVAAVVCAYAMALAIEVGFERRAKT